MLPANFLTHEYTNLVNIYFSERRNGGRNYEGEGQEETAGFGVDIGLAINVKARSESGRFAMRYLTGKIPSSTMLLKMKKKNGYSRSTSVHPNKSVTKPVKIETI